MQKPFKTYFGGKEAPGVYQTIVNYIRPHDLFVEPFGGNFAVSRKMNNRGKKFVGEIDLDVFLRYPPCDEVFSFFRMDYRDLIELFVECSMFDRRVIYFDPPYPLSTISGGRAVYPYTFTDKDHVDFLNYANSIKEQYDVLISTYPNDLYREMLENWHLVEFEGWSRHGKKTEWLFLNYSPEEITALHDPQFYGKDFIERQRIARSIRNVVRKIVNHPDPVIKAEILQQLNNST